MSQDSANKDPLTIRGAAGKPIVLPIANGPATGYSWQFELPPGVHRLDDAPRSPPSGSSMAGGSMRGEIQLTAPAGSYTVIGRLVRPWQRDQPIRTVTIHLRITP